MNNRQNLVFLALLAVLLTGCTSPDAVAQEIGKLENALIPLKDLAFIPSLDSAVPWFGILRWLSFPALIGLCLALIRWQSREPSRSNEVAGRFALLFIIGLVSTGTVFIALDTVGRAAWSPDLTFHYVRVSLGWTIPFIEGGSSGDWSIFSLALSLFTATGIPLAHMLAQIVLIVITVIAVFTATFSGQWLSLERLGLAWFLWAFFPLLWTLVISFLRRATEAGFDPGSIHFGFVVVSWILFGAVSLVPFWMPWPQTPVTPVVPAPTAHQRQTDPALTAALVGGLTGYAAGQAGGQTGPQPRGGGAWPMGPSGSTGPRPTALPPPRTPNGGSGQAGGVTAPHSRGALSDPQGRAPNAAGSDHLPSSRSANGQVAGAASAVAQVGGSNGSNGRSSTLPPPRTPRGSSAQIGADPAAASPTVSGNGRGQTAYFAREDLIEAGEGSQSRTIMFQGQMLVPDGEEDGYLIVGGDRIPKSMVERRPVRGGGA